MWHGGKGSKSRITDFNKYGNEYDRIFKASKEEFSNCKRHLLLDDIRHPKQCNLVYPTHTTTLLEETNTFECDWIVVRTLDNFKEWIYTNGPPELLSLDNDLTMSHYERYVEVLGGRDSYDYEKEDDNGIAALKFVIKYCKEHGKKLPKIYVHTANQIARNVMTAKINEISK